MFRYMNYQFTSISKKITTYVLPILSFLALLIPLILLQGKIAHGSGISSTNLFLQNPIYIIILFVVVTLFLATKVLNIFKDGEDDGSELLVVSKPLTRKQIIFGKFFTLYSLIGIFSLFMFIVSFIVSSIDRESTTMHKFTFSLSIMFGTFISSMIISTLIIVISTFFNKVFTLGAALLLAIIIPAISTFGFVRGGHGNIASANSKNVNIKPNKQNIFINKTKGTQRIYVADGYIKNAVHKVNKGWYKLAAYVDPWLHISNFYKVFTKGSVTADTVTDWDIKTSKLNTDFKVSIRTGVGINSKNKQVAIIPTVDTKDFYNIINERYKYKGKGILENSSITPYSISIRDKDNSNKTVNVKNIYDAIYAQVINTNINNVNSSFDFNAKINVIQKMFIQYRATGQITNEYWKYSGVDYNIQELVKLASLYIFSKFTTERQKDLRLNLISYADNNLKVQNNIKIVGSTSNVEIAKEKPFAPLWAMLITWILIILVINAVVITKFLKRDFK